MVDIYGSHFEYGGTSSETHGIILANAETDRFTQVAGTISGVTIFNKRDKVNYLIDDDYTGSPLSFDVDIITDDDRILSSGERRTIERWLFNRHNYKKLYVNGSADCENITALTLEPYRVRVTGAVPGISYKGVSTESSTPSINLKVYFTLASGQSISNYTFLVDGESDTPVSSSPDYYVRKYQIYSNAYDVTHVITVSDGTNTMEVRCSVLTYAYDVLASDTSSHELRETASDLYRAFLSNGGTTEYVGSMRLRLYLNCRFINPHYLEYNGGIVGYRATVETDCGYWWQDEVTTTYTLNHTAGSDRTNIIVDVDTDIDDYTYPQVMVTMNSNGGGFSLSNQSDSAARATTFTGIAAGATVTINGSYNYVSGQYYEKFLNQNFPRLLPGANTLSIIGNVASVKISFSNRRNL